MCVCLLGLFACLVIASRSQDLPRPRAYRDAVGLSAVRNEFVGFEAHEALHRTVVEHIFVSNCTCVGDTYYPHARVGAWPHLRSALEIQDDGWQRCCCCTTQGYSSTGLNVQISCRIFVFAQRDLELTRASPALYCCTDSIDVR